MTERIRDAARRLFAERGYAATTTREIARLADVSETLLFRHYGGKARLFAEVVAEPLNRLMADFVARHPDASAEATRGQDAARFVRRVHDLLEAHRELLTALVAAPGQHDFSGVDRLQGYFEQAVAQLEIQYAAQGDRPEFDLGVGVRLGFGMIAASVLLRPWLFPEPVPSPDAITDVLERMVARALGPPAR